MGSHGLRPGHATPWPLVEVVLGPVGLAKRQERESQLGASGNALRALEEDKQEEVNLTSKVPQRPLCLKREQLGGKDADK